jgi:uncharacterized protein YjbI with pentapeptide repeats
MEFSRTELALLRLPGPLQLVGADLSHAPLMGAVLDHANLRAANLSGARVTHSQLDQAQSLAGATLPDHGARWAPDA